MKLAIQRFRTSDNMADVVAEIRTNGVAVLENLFKPEAMDQLMAKLTPELDKQEPAGGQFFGNRKRSVTALFARGAAFSEHLLLNECILEVMDGILLPEHPMASSAPARDPVPFEAYFQRQIDPKVGPNCHHYRLNASVAMQVCKGGSNQVLHQDESRYLPYFVRDPEGPELTLAVMVAASEFTEDNGATRFVPGSNRWPAGRLPEDQEVIQATMAKGSVALWLGSVYHGLGTSRVDEPRNGLIYSFGVDHLTQEENQFMAVPWEIARELPKRAQQLIGYRQSVALNFIEGLEDEHVLDVRVGS